MASENREAPMRDPGEMRVGDDVWPEALVEEKRCGLIFVVSINDGRSDGLNTPEHITKWGVPKKGDTPIAGWLREDPNLKWMMNRGTPIYGNLHFA